MRRLVELVGDISIKCFSSENSDPHNGRGVTPSVREAGRHLPNALIPEELQTANAGLPSYRSKHISQLHLGLPCGKAGCSVISLRGTSLTCSGDVWVLEACIFPVSCPSVSPYLQLERDPTGELPHCKLIPIHHLFVQEEIFNVCPTFYLLNGSLWASFAVNHSGSFVEKTRLQRASIWDAEACVLRG